MKTETIKITNQYLDTMTNNPVVQTIIKKPFTAKTSYWLARVFDKLQRETKIYLNEKQKLIEKYAKRYDADGKNWKKGDMITDGQSISLTNIKDFTKEINELTEIEIEIGINKITFDIEKEPACTIEEMTILLLLLDVKE